MAFNLDNFYADWNFSLKPNVLKKPFGYTPEITTSTWEPEIRLTIKNLNFNCQKDVDIIFEQLYNKGTTLLVSCPIFNQDLVEKVYYEDTDLRLSIVTKYNSSIKGISWYRKVFYKATTTVILKDTGIRFTKAYFYGTNNPDDPGYDPNIPVNFQVAIQPVPRAISYYQPNSTTAIEIKPVDCVVVKKLFDASFLIGQTLVTQSMFNESISGLSLVTVNVYNESIWGVSLYVTSSDQVGRSVTTRSINPVGISRVVKLIQDIRGFSLVTGNQYSYQGQSLITTDQFDNYTGKSLVTTDYLATFKGRSLVTGNYLAVIKGTSTVTSDFYSYISKSLVTVNYFNYLGKSVVTANYFNYLGKSEVTKNYFNYLGKSVIPLGDAFYQGRSIITRDGLYGRSIVTS